MFKDYVNELIRKEFVLVEIGKKGRKLFSITGKGNEFLEEYKVIERFVDNFGL